MPENHRLVPFLEIDARFLSNVRRHLPARIEPSLQRARQRVGLGRGADERAGYADHVENAGDVSLIEPMHGDARTDQGGNDVGLQIGKRQNQIGIECEDFRDVGADEGGDARLLLAHPRRAHGIAGDADDAMLFAEEIERLHGLFGQADDSLRREFRWSM